MEPSLIQRFEDQRSAWNSGQRVLVEELVDSSVQPGDLMDLIYSEVVLRESAGETVTPGEYCERFPELATEIARQFQIHSLLSSDAGIILPATDAARIEIPGFELLEQAGSGGSGVVYKARDRKIDRVVAIKVLGVVDAIQKKRREQLMREAAAAASLKHPGIVEVYQLGESGGAPFVVMEFMSAGSLGELVRKDPLSPERALQILIPVTEAVRHAHQNGVIHRDLKPDNILLDDDEEPHVADFGLARRLDQNQSIHATGDVIGTPAYMSPEQVRGETATVQSDVYSLGAILYQVLTGRAPFQAATAWEVLEQALTHDPPKLRTLNPALPKDLETICEKCLQKVPERRYDSTIELLADLKLASEGRPIVARPVNPFDRFIRWCKREPRLAFAAAATLALAVTLTVVSTLAIDRITNAESATAAQRELARGSSVQAVIGSAPDAVPTAIAALRRDDPETVRLLAECADDANRDAGERLRAACGLAALGRLRTQFILDSVMKVPAQRGTCQNILTALGTPTPELIRELSSRAAAGSSENRMRYAILALFLGSPDAAETLVATGVPDQLPRTRLVHGMNQWMGPDEVLATLVRGTADPQLQASLCLAIGNIDKLTIQRIHREEILAHLNDLRMMPTKRAVVHSAADWAARRWGAPERSVPANNGPDWFVNSIETTMIRVAPGTFQMASTNKVKTFHEVTLSRAVWWADREVSRAQFDRFLKECPDAVGARRQVDTLISPTEEHPVQNLSWNLAVEFCNWLSVRENRKPCYSRRNADADLSVEENRSNMWNCDFDADGYRLPTDAEWEYVARCGSLDRYTFGDDNLVRFYARASNDLKIPALPCRSLIPNPHGLFDIYGNVWEWSWDQWCVLDTSSQADPIGPPVDLNDPKRIVRGGAIDNLSGDPCNDARGGINPTWSAWNLGFRVVATAK